VGNGAATAILFAREGAKVVLVDAVPESVEPTRATIDSEGGETISVVADVTQAEDCQRAVEAAVESYGALHILHNNVGGRSASGTVVEASDDDWRQSTALNVMSAIHMSRYSVPHMKSSGGGAITNVSSVAALRPKRDASSALYTVDKAAVVGLTGAMALDHAADNIRVNCIMPGLMWTPGLWHQPAEQREIRRTSTPLPVEGEGWDIAWAAVYLVSDEARFVTGIVLPVDGGFLLTSAPN
jgi:NAD(P)-dependent dehydrogenase (short-subunit alcohol dehydrogenase family)